MIRSIDRRDARYLWLIVLYLAAYFVVERANPGAQYHVVHSFLDDLIIFNEYFAIAYFSWHVLLPGVIIYMLFTEKEIFRKLMAFLAIGFCISFAVYIIYPTCQELRPEVFEHSNIFTRMMSIAYTVDTPTNITPSMHVIGSMGIFFAFAYSKRKALTVYTRLWMALAVVLICISTFVVKQHSVIDVVAAFPVIMIAWFFTFNESLPQFLAMIRREFSRRSVLNIVNAITAVRLLLIPIIIGLFRIADYDRLATYIAVSALFYGAELYLAPEKGYTTQAGKMIAIFADRLNQALLMILAAQSYRWAWVLLYFFIFMEVCRTIYVYGIFNRFNGDYSNRWYGVLSSVSVYICMSALILYPDISRGTSRMLTVICFACVVFALIMYSSEYFRLVWGNDFRKNSAAAGRIWAVTILILAALTAAHVLSF